MTKRTEDESFPEERLLSLLRVSRPEAAWLRQRNQILARVRAPRPWVTPRRLAPVLAAAMAIALFFIRTGQKYAPDDVPPAGEWVLLENLELLEDLDVIEVMDEGDS